MSNSQSPTDVVQANITSLIDHQKINSNTSETQFLDNLTSEFLKSVVLDKNLDINENGLKRASVCGMLLPKEYNKRCLSSWSMQNKSFPFHQQIQFVVQCKKENKIETNFSFLRPILKNVKKMEEVEINYQKSGKGLVTENRLNSTQSISISGKEHKQGIHVVDSCLFNDSESIENLLSNEKLIPFEIPKIENETFFDQDDKEQTKRNDSTKKLIKIEAKKLTGVLQISAREIAIDGYYEITIRVENISKTTFKEAEKGKNSREPAANYVFPYAFFGTQLTVKANSGSILLDDGNSSIESAELKFALKQCTSSNTIPKINSSTNELFANPIGIIDHPRISPKKADVTFDFMLDSKENFLKSLTLLNDSEIQALTNEKISLLLEIFRALKDANPSFPGLYKFQFEGIQKFLKKLLNTESSPLVIRAPTDSGKSLVFYVCSAIQKVLNELHGTSTLITFPTKALNASQFNDMTRFFYYLNKRGIDISLGYYTGSFEGGEFDPNSISNAKNVSGGEPLNLIRECPNCNDKQIVVEKIDDLRIIPKCSSCNEKFNFIFVTNKEVESYCPNVIIGTPDKFWNSISGFLPSHTIFGAPSKRCPHCKFVKPLIFSDQSEELHNCPRCNTEMDKNTKFHSSPSLIVFDEVHTLSGTSGNLFGHFLSLLKVTNESYGIKNPIQHLGATATIANQDELMRNLTGWEINEETVFPKEENFWTDYFEKNMEDIRHRFVIVEPTIVSTNDSVERMSLSGLEAIKKIVKGTGYEKFYKLQTIYVRRKIDGIAITQSLPNRAIDDGHDLGPEDYKFAKQSKRQEIFDLLSQVEKNELDILITTSVLGQGVDFPNINIMHFFGVPNSFVELAQVAGRTGRGNLPSLIFIHIRPDIPRDRLIYENVEKTIGHLDKWYEPMPINVMNSYAIDISLPNIALATILSRQSKDYNLMHIGSAFKKIVEMIQNQELKNILAQVYKKYWVKDEDWEKLVEHLQVQSLLTFKNAATKSGFTSNVFHENKILTSTLHESDEQVKLFPQFNYPVLNTLTSFRGRQND